MLIFLYFYVKDKIKSLWIKLCQQRKNRSVEGTRLQKIYFMVRIDHKHRI